MQRLRFDVSCSVLFTDLPLSDRPRAARSAGFDAVEFRWPFATASPPRWEVDAFTRAIHDAGVELIALALFAGDVDSGDRGIASWPGREGEFRESLDIAAGIARSTGCLALAVLYGNRLAGAAAAEQERTALENLAYASEAASQFDGTISIEPLSGAESYPLRTAADVVSLIAYARNYGCEDRLRLLADLYHLGANGDDIVSAVTSYSDLIDHVQIADWPGRHEPGTGELPLASALMRLEALGYDGWVGLEYIPRDEQPDPFAWLPADKRLSARPSRTDQRKERQGR